MSGIYNDKEFTCTNGKSYRCEAYKDNPNLYMIKNSKGLTLDVMSECVLREILEGRKVLSYQISDIVKTMVIQEEDGE